MQLELVASPARPSWPGVTAEESKMAAERVRASVAQLSAAGVTVRVVHSTLVVEDEAAFSLLEAESRAAVEEVYARAGIGFEHVVDALRIATGGAGQ